MSDWNATCGLSNRVQRVEANVPAYYYPFNLFVIASWAVYTVLTIAWFVVERKKTLFLQKRSLEAIISSAIGGLTIVIMGPIRNINSANFSCDFFMLVMTMAVPLVLTPMALRLYMFRNSLEWNKHLAKTSMMRLNHAVGYTEKDAQSNAKQHRKSVYHGVKSVRVATSGGGATGGGGGANSSLVEDQSTVSGSRMESITLGLWFRSSIWFPLALGLLAYTLYFLLLALPLLLIKPWYGKGCVGCLYHLDEQIPVFLGALVSASFITYFAWDIRNERDPLLIRNELVWVWPGAVIVGSVGALGITFDLVANHGAVEDRALIQWEWFLVGTVMWIHMYSCPLQIWKSRRITHIQGLPSRAEFVELLKNQQFYSLFESYCVAEFSVENVKFYRSVQVDYKDKYAQLSGRERDALAAAIYNAYITSSAVMEINIKHHVRAALDAYFGKELVVDVPIDIFDEAQDEILDLMRKDSLGRWAATKEYQDWTTRSVIIREGKVSVLA